MRRSAQLKIQTLFAAVKRGGEGSEPPVLAMQDERRQQGQGRAAALRASHENARGRRAGMGMDREHPHPAEAPRKNRKAVRQRLRAVDDHEASLRTQQVQGCLHPQIEFALARANLAANGMDGRGIVVEGDVRAPRRERAAAGLAGGDAALVLCNPPWLAPGRSRASPHAQRRVAHMLGEGELDLWVKA
ncbi:hypothetical protein WDZ92_53760, partial [Nostoc sp. NIES-2111]